MNNTLKVGDYVTTNAGFTGHVAAILTGQLAGLVAIAFNGKGVTVHAYDVIKLPALTEVA